MDTLSMLLKISKLKCLNLLLMIILYIGEPHRYFLKFNKNKLIVVGHVLLSFVVKIKMKSIKKLKMPSKIILLTRKKHKIYFLMIKWKDSTE